MFETLKGKLQTVFDGLAKRGALSEADVDAALREVRLALLDADVALPVVKSFIEKLRNNAVGVASLRSVRPDQQVIKIVHDALIEMLGGDAAPLNIATNPPAVILMAGLQGAGKTTSVAKIAKMLKEQEKKSVLVVSADTYRPAAIQQLKTLSIDLGVDFFNSDESQAPIEIVRGALLEAGRKFFDVLIVDTAGRLALDEQMMNEIQRLHAELNPVETLFVVDAMTGQDAAITAKAFDDI